MPRLSTDQLAGLTLARQFPPVTGRDRAALLALISRVGPIQSQVPRAPFVGMAARLPGIDYATVRDAFADLALVKGSNLRGTVHVSDRHQFGWLDAASRPERAKAVRLHLKLERTDPEQLAAAIETICGPDWVERSELVGRARDWLADHDEPATADRVSGTLAESLIWGHSGLCRRPHDGRWERRTDVQHRAAREAPTSDGLDPIPTVDPDEAIEELVRIHLGAYGPARLVDIAWWTGVRLTPIKQALARLEPELTRSVGPAGEDLLDLAEFGEPGSRSNADPGTRLLPEFDGLTVGYRQDGRDRFVDAEHLGTIWSSTNGQVSPVVLHHGRLVGRWRTVPTTSRGSGRGSSGVRIEVLPFRRGHGLRPADLDGPAGDVALVLDQHVEDIAVLAPTLDQLPGPAGPAR